MSAARLTHTEAWALALLLHLPVQPGSALADWLLSASAPDPAELSAPAFDGLAAKGLYHAQAAEPFDPGLLRALTLTAINAATVTALIRANGKAALTRFAQADESLVQYGMDEHGMTLHDVQPMHAVAGNLLPGWFTVNRNEGLRDTLPLGAFLLFNHACALADWAWGRSELQSEVFPVAELFETFQRSAGWVDIFNAAGMAGVMELAQMPLSAYLELLLARGYLCAMGSEQLAVGPMGDSLAEALSASTRCTLTVTLQTWEAPAALCGTFLHGSDRLFLLEFAPGQVGIQQLSGVEQGRAWIEALLNQGRQAHYVDYVLPAADSAGESLHHRVAVAPPALVVPAVVIPPLGPAPEIPPPQPVVAPPPMPEAVVAPPLPQPVVTTPPIPEAVIASPPLPEPVVAPPPIPEAVVTPPPVVAPPPAPEAAEMFCSNCGSPVRATQRFCRTCGARLVPPDAAAAPPPPAAPVNQSAPTVRGMVPPISAKLRMLSGAQAGQEFIVGPQVRLGREPDNEVVLLDPKVSRHHALLQQQGETFLLTDLGSSNGVSVNGKRIAAPESLKDGDILILGDTQLAFKVNA